MKTIWKLWKKFGKFIGTLISTILSWLMYIIIITPVGIIFTFFLDTLKIKRKYESMWSTRIDKDIDLESMRRQY